MSPRRAGAPVLECANAESRYLPASTTSEDPAMSEIDRERTLARFWAKVNKTDGCWEWSGAINTGGYGSFWNGIREVKAHRFAYELLCEQIRDGLTLDHLCRNRSCVNPAHLEPVTGK